MRSNRQQLGTLEDSISQALLGEMQQTGKKLYRWQLISQQYCVGYVEERTDGQEEGTIFDTDYANGYFFNVEAKQNNSITCFQATPSTPIFAFARLWQDVTFMLLL